MDDRLRDLGLLDDGDIDIAEAGLLLAAPDHVNADPDAGRSWLTGLVLRLQRDAAGVASPRERARCLAERLSGDEGLTGDSADYDNPLNADLLALVERRRGLPVTLSILYVAVARRLGWVADPLGIPGHVLVRIGAEPAMQLIDPFDHGRLLGADGLHGVLTRTLGAQSMIEPEHLVPLSNRAVLVRLVANQATRARRGGDVARALVLHERMTAIAPGFTGLWWERARLEQLLGHVGAARASLGAMLETTRDAAVRSRIRAALEALARSNS